jgi:hypothetical protein
MNEHPTARVPVRVEQMNTLDTHNRIDRLAQPDGPDLYHEIMEVQDLGCEQVTGRSKVPIENRKQVK